VSIIRENKQIPLELGWFVVQNRSSDADVLFDREKEENETLSKFPWLDLSPHRRGVSMLKRFLANLLCKKIREAFPDMQKSISGLLAIERAKIKELGDPRPTRTQRLQYLYKIVREYNDMAHKALNSPQDLPSTDMKLRGFTRQASDDFAEAIRTKGHLHEFMEIGASVDETFSRNIHPLYSEIRQQIHDNRGEELHGMMNAAIMKPLFRKQSSRWEGLGEGHLNWVISKTTEVAIKILVRICRQFSVPGGTRVELEEFITKFQDEARERAIQKLKRFYRDTFLRLPLHTDNEQFIQKVTSAQHLRFRAALARYQKKIPPTTFLVSLLPDQNPTNIANIPSVFGSWAIVDLNDIDELFEQMHPRGVQNIEDEIHDLLKAYYDGSNIIRSCTPHSPRPPVHNV
jgi:hypothetical protein